jgi:hypothetical protein
MFFLAFWQNFSPEKKMVQQHNARSCFGRCIWANPKKNKNKIQRKLKTKTNLAQ